MFQGYVDASPSDAFKEIVVNIESSPSWNPTLMECRVCSSVLHFRSWFCKKWIQKSSLGCHTSCSSLQYLV